jgi:transcription antitermination factor NusA-like protein
MSDYNSNAVDKIRQDGWAKVCLLSKEAMRAEIARVVHQAWQDKVGKLIGLSKK